MEAPSLVLWLHGRGDSGPANEHIRFIFSSPEFKNTRWSFPSAPHKPVTCSCFCFIYSLASMKAANQINLGCNAVWTLEALLLSSNHCLMNGIVMPSWFDVYELPISAESPKDEKGVLKAVENVHAMIDKEVAAGTNSQNIFVCGFSQGGALALASVLLYPKALGGGAIFSGWLPFNSSIVEQISPEARKTPILWCHGTADKRVLFTAGQAGHQFLKQAGMSCEFKAYPDLGHFIDPEEFQSLESWIKNHLKNSS